MSEMQIQSVLQQMRALSQSGRIEGSASAGEVKEARQADGVDFASNLQEAIRGVNEVQQESSVMQTQFELGEENVSLPQVMIAMNKASIAFEATNQVRNRLLSAYQEVMSMQV
ncbi:flagellar hook-basal body complex protein FliE [Thiorhodococcus mannitoliphagus]|uniref:Flagellar hook-basal body complex protein FliE n=1 Tax=Thiorhodococcus mannitoliphagus TaxID=329406 RepID=A0A6P1DWT3_9GAMM|nr:flagellar hook-basal body complex protein FliE [Thiorhodococcus mannitoliphagus]NEX20115.1 flagellar hook-basal body complex protein FliE [Thiorhodococcus mannitoliphagus]